MERLIGSAFSNDEMNARLSHTQERLGRDTFSLPPDTGGDQGQQRNGNAKCPKPRDAGRLPRLKKKGSDS